MAASSLYCGGDTQLYVLSKENDPRKEWGLWDETEVIKTFQTDLKPVLVGAYHRSITDEEFEKRLAILVSELREARRTITKGE